jgi:hypothetical protein
MPAPGAVEHLGMKEVAARPADAVHPAGLGAAWEEFAEVVLGEVKNGGDFFGGVTRGADVAVGKKFQDGEFDFFKRRDGHGRRENKRAIRRKAGLIGRGLFDVSRRNSI